MKIIFFCVLVVIYYLHPTVSVPPPCVEDGQEYPPGAKWTVVVNGECEGRSCSRTGELSMSGCPKYKLREGCYLTRGDLTKSYPDCCPKPVCPPPP
ncbi:la1-like protein 13 [Homalodisca vitripennis]|uniref:la1-like protein 13 n=1 Tax=Homalodisca vitripennis TaxID=197043 RepID=UPI001EEB11DE|nr:la1-like protein 13 [Homalodisca vitripennis]